MRKYSGLLVALILLALPAFASAAQLTVKVTGGTAGSNYVALTGGITKASITSGTSYYYPSVVPPVVPTVIAIRYSGSTAPTVTPTGATLTSTSSVPGLVKYTFTPVLSTDNGNITVAYSTAVTTGYVTFTQPSGGTIYVQLPNGTFTSVSPTIALPAGTTCPVTVSPDSNHTVTSTTGTTTSLSSAAGQPATGLVTIPVSGGPVNIVANLGFAAKNTVSLKTAGGGFSGQAMTVSATSTSNDSGAAIAFTVTGAATGSQIATLTNGGPVSFTFSPSANGTATVTATASSANGGPVSTSADITIGNKVAADNNICFGCHNSSTPLIVANYVTSGHNISAASQCAACHTNGTDGAIGTVGVHEAAINKTNINPSTFAVMTSTGIVKDLAKGYIFCNKCHSSYNTVKHAAVATASAKTCAGCHTPAGAGDAHSVMGCVGCHSVVQNSGPGFVQDNAGVRAVTTEFSKWSHHVTGVTLQDAHCAACHLEGKASDRGGIEVDQTYHRADAMTHLRNADTDADMQWDPANPNHTTMDNFCMSCHDANGATSADSVAIRALMVPAVGKTASATNPFGDTISNQYDKMQRPAVVDASSQFNTTNNSHHAVKGKRYSGRTRVAGSRQLLAPTTFANNSSANLPGARTTIFDAGKFNQLYVPLVNNGGEAAPRTGASALGDDSTLHCGDCHTVGQWKVGSSTNAAGLPTPAAIGAHGSTNEYLLRNSIGTDARHQGIQMDASAMHADSVTPYLVCYNCHAIANYGLSSHIGEQVVGENNCDTPTNTNTVNAIGTDRITSQYTMSYGANVVGTPTGATNGNIYGIQCNNCHNSGISAGNIFGGIHGSADPTYKDGAGNTTKHERFLPGLGNVMYAPGTRGGITGGTVAFQSYSSKVQTSGISKGLRFKGTYAYTTAGVTNDTNWEEKSRIPVGDGVTGWSHNPGAAGCYTISEEAIVPYNAESNGVPAGAPASLGLTDPNGVGLVGTWGGCVDHGQQQGASVRQPRNTNTSIRPVTY